MFRVNKKDKYLGKKSQKSLFENAPFRQNTTSNINKKATNTINCEGTPAQDTTACPGAIKGVGATLATTPYSQTNFETAINTYITECKTTGCAQGCSAVISAKTFATAPAGFATSFVTCGGPDPVPTAGVGTCEDPEVDTPTTCEEKYEDVLTATSPWVPNDVKGAIDDFITSCPTTSCKPECSAVISEKNVATEYSSLKTAFVAQCNPKKENENTKKDNSLGLIRVSVSLIAMSIGVSIVHLILVQ
jgi:hypothetical protein